MGPASQVNPSSAFNRSTETHSHEEVVHGNLQELLQTNASLPRVHGRWADLSCLVFHHIDLIHHICFVLAMHIVLTNAATTWPVKHRFQGLESNIRPTRVSKRDLHRILRRGLRLCFCRQSTVYTVQRGKNKRLEPNTEQGRETHILQRTGVKLHYRTPAKAGRSMKSVYCVWALFL